MARLTLDAVLKKKSCPIPCKVEAALILDSIRIRIETGSDYFARRRRTKAARPSNPVPIMIIEPGSGTADTITRVPCE